MFGDQASVKFEPLKFNYVGSANSEVYLCIAWKDAPVQSFDDVFVKRMILGASRHGGTIGCFRPAIEHVGENRGCTDVHDTSLLLPTTFGH